MKCNILTLTLTISLIVPSLALAQNGDDLGIYAGMAKLEANVGEAAGKLAFYVLNSGSGDYAEQYAEDVISVYGYLRALEAMNISDEQQSVVDSFRNTWGTVEDEGEELIAAVDAGSSANELLDRLNTWYESLDALDETIDGELEALLAENDLTVEPISREEAEDADNQDD